MSLMASGLFLLFLSGSAFAHEGAGAAAPADGGWSFDPWLVIPLCIAAILFAIGTRSLWRHAGPGRGIAYWQVACFFVAWLMLTIALISPFHQLAERLLTAHMIEHEMIMAVAAPLVILSRPLVAFIWATPIGVRRWCGSLVGLRPVVAVLAVVADASAATALHIGTVFAWHAPRLFDAAIEVPALHKLQHVSFLATALLFWWAVLRLPSRQHGSAALHLFAIMMAMSLLGALLTLAPHAVYAAYSSPRLGFTALQDQQLAGLMMWIPGCAVYAVATLALLASWIRSSGRALRASHYQAAGPIEARPNFGKRSMA